MDEQNNTREMEMMYYNNAATLTREVQWLSEVIDTRMKLHFRADVAYASITEIPVPDLTNDPSAYAVFLKKKNASPEERLVLITALVPHVKPEVFDVFFVDKTQNGGKFTEFGGIKGTQHVGFLPTIETLVFILAGENMDIRFRIGQLFSSDHWFISEGIIVVNNPDATGKEPFFSTPLSVSPDHLTYFTTGEAYDPQYSSRFPAQKITTELDWDELILPPHVSEELDDLVRWIKNEQRIMVEWGLKKRLKPGYRSLFYGPPGTGKTLAVALIGKKLGLPVYRIDLSKLISKYIGETEKNLAHVFDQAQNKNWILFFDEADALFGKRSGGNTSNDRHSNQEIAYLLQRIEDYPGTVILASNLKSNMDDAFIRRFQSMIHFPLPEEFERLKLWERVFETGGLEVDKNVDFPKIAKDHALAGGSIINVLRFAAIKALNRNPERIMHEDIKAGIRKELRKEGKG